MSTPLINPVAQLIRRILDDPRVKNASDLGLLQRFLADGDEAAFEAILRRHGPMVFDVCRSMLPNETDVEDAFQATFLILATRASSIRRTSSLASWLHGVAYRVACKSLTEFARRQRHEAGAALPAESNAADDLSWRELRQVVHEELDRLPSKCREALALCYLQGMTQDQAAAELGVPKGTLKGRLEQGRALLRARLVRRGLGPTAVLVACAWPAAALSTHLPGTLVAATRTACTGIVAGHVLATLVSPRVFVLVRGFLQSLFWKKLTLSAAALAGLVFVCLAGYGLVVYSAEAAAHVPDRKPLVPMAADEVDHRWAKSNDGVLALRMSADPPHAEPFEATTLTASLRNLSRQPVLVIRPFGRGADCIHMKGLNIQGRTAHLRYFGPQDDKELVQDAFVWLRPGEMIHDRIVIRNAFEGFRLRGVSMPEVDTITIEYVYEANQVGPDNVWNGKVASKAVSAAIQKKDR